MPTVISTEDAPVTSVRQFQAMDWKTLKYFWPNVIGLTVSTAYF